MTVVAVSVGLLLAVEGLLLAAWPALARRAAKELLETPEDRLRAGGLLAATAGVAIIWLFRL